MDIEVECEIDPTPDTNPTLKLASSVAQCRSTTSSGVCPVTPHEMLKSFMALRASRRAVITSLVICDTCESKTSLIICRVRESPIEHQPPACMIRLYETYLHIDTTFSWTLYIYIYITKMNDLKESAEYYLLS